MKPTEDILAETELHQRSARTLSSPLSWRKTVMQMVLLVCLCASYTAAQAIVEYGHATAAMSATTSAVRSVEKGIALPAKQAGLALSRNNAGESAEAANRDALALHAGKHRAKLMLRSVPSQARVWIDGTPVGRTPLLLIIAPGVYNVEMGGGARMDFGRRRVDLLPSETREIMVPLTPRYPASIRIKWPTPNRHGEGAQHGGI